jgi:hypothetical protein
MSLKERRTGDIVISDTFFAVLVLVLARTIVEPPSFTATFSHLVFMLSDMALITLGKFLFSSVSNLFGSIGFWKPILFFPGGVEADLEEFPNSRVLETSGCFS